MKLKLDTTGVKCQASGGFEPRLDKDGVHRRDKSGGTNLALYAVKLVVWLADGDVETVLVTVAADNPPELTQGQFVSVDGLEAMPWVQNGNIRVAFRAKSVIPAGNSSIPKPMPASAAN